MNKDYLNKLIASFNNKEIELAEFEKEINRITEELKEPLKLYYRIACYSLGKKVYYTIKDKKDLLLENYQIILASELITEKEKSIIKCILLHTYFGEYNYEQAEKYASELLQESENQIDEIILRELANYYTKTRRYHIARNIYNKLNIDSNSGMLYKEYTVYQDIVNGNRKDYYPASLENKEKYDQFMKLLNIDITKTSKKSKSTTPQKIDKEDYPNPVEEKKTGFLDFTAFDLETTGINPNRDAIFEIAAIKVRNGEIVEKKDYIFQEFVKPYKSKIHDDVEKLTGVSQDMVKNARKVWEVLADFLDFIGDDILLGYNCMAFDSKFLARAGRISNIIIKNKYFDVLPMAKKYQNIIKSNNMKLVEVGKSLGIENPQAHRALADSITTARVYLKILEIEKEQERLIKQ